MRVASGVWQSVHLERRNADHISGVRLRPNLATTGRVTAHVLLSRPTPEPLEAELFIKDTTGAVVAELATVAPAGADAFTADLVAPQVPPWSRDGAALDHREEMFGLRTFEACNGRFYLNGEPIYLRSALDQDYYLDTICATPSAAFLENQFRKAKALGLNSLRCHIKAVDPRYMKWPTALGC